jgi:transposase
MKYVGVDLHQQVIEICVVNQERQVLERRRFLCCDTDCQKEWLAGLGDFELVVEATASYEWFVQLAEPHARRIVLTHPGKLRVIAESTRKSDKLDSQTLAVFLAAGMIPAAHRPTPRQREHRRLARYRHHVQGRITSLKNRIRRILSDYNLDRRDLFTKAGREHAQHVKLLDADRFVLDELYASLDHYAEQLVRAQQALAKFARTSPPSEKLARKRLRSIPGVGRITIEVFLAETADVRRFSSQKKLTAYAGLSPGSRESAGKRKDLGITHTGSKLLRWVVGQAAWQLVRRDERWRRIFVALTKRRGKKKAIVAVTRRLLCLMMSLVIHDQPYRRAA